MDSCVCLVQMFSADLFTVDQTPVALVPLVLGIVQSGDRCVIAAPTVSVLIDTDIYHPVKQHIAENGAGPEVEARRGSDCDGKNCFSSLFLEGSRQFEPFAPSNLLKAVSH